MSDYSQVKINGSNYYIVNSYVDDLVVLNGELVNFGSTAINLYRTIPENNDSSYPYIRINSLHSAIYYEDQRTNYPLNLSSFEIVHQPLTYTVEAIYLYFVILGVLICQLFKR